MGIDLLLVRWREELENLALLAYGSLMAFNSIRRNGVSDASQAFHCIVQHCKKGAMGHAPSMELIDTCSHSPVSHRTSFNAADTLDCPVHKVGSVALVFYLVGGFAFVGVWGAGGVWFLLAGLLISVCVRFVVVTILTLFACIVPLFLACLRDRLVPLSVRMSSHVNN